MSEIYPKYEECKKCNYYEDNGLYERCLWTCKIHYKKVQTRASKMFTNNADAQIAFRELCELIAWKIGRQWAISEFVKRLKVYNYITEKELKVLIKECEAMLK